MYLKPELVTVLILVLLNVAQLRNDRHDRMLSKGGPWMPPGNCQCPGVNFSWRCSYPEMVPKILPFCGSACTSDHNKVSIHKAHGLPCTTLASACWITRPCEAFAAGWPTTRAVLRVQVFLEGVKAALTADAKYNGGNYSPDDKPIVGLKAFGRVYAGESLSPTIPQASCAMQLSLLTCEVAFEARGPSKENRDPALECLAEHFN